MSNQLFANEFSQSKIFHTRLLARLLLLPITTDVSVAPTAYTDETEIHNALALNHHL